MATYEDIQNCVKKKGYTPKTCWIADVKNKHGINRKDRNGSPRKHPCPTNNVKDIEECLKKFKMI